MAKIHELGLGRLIAPDKRDEEFRMRALTPRVQVIPFTRSWRVGPILDQGSQPHCVGFSWAQFIASAPLMKAHQANPTLLYHKAQLVDEWEGTSYDGTSVRAGAKVLQEWQFISGYVWGYSAKEVRDYILTRGPVVVGTDWYDGMFNVTPSGYIELNGDPVGGHAYLLAGYSVQRNAFRIVNSWGKDWGQLGRAWITFANMDILIKGGGEACSAIETGKEFNNFKEPDLPI